MPLLVPLLTMRNLDLIEERGNSICMPTNLCCPFVYEANSRKSAPFFLFWIFKCTLVEGFAFSLLFWENDRFSTNSNSFLFCIIFHGNQNLS